MKKYLMLLGLCIAMASCQDELYNKPVQNVEGFNQAAYFTTPGAFQTFVLNHTSETINDLQVGLVRKVDESVKVQVAVGNQADLDLYNKANNTNYLLLPSSMYVAPKEITFDPLVTTTSLPLVLKDMTFSPKGNYALPVSIKGDGCEMPTITGENKAILIFNQKILTSVLKINGNGTSSDKMFPADYAVDQWTMEVMIKRDRYDTNNQSICGTTTNDPAARSEIYPRFGDVTINTNQLQIKTGGSQIDIPSDQFVAKENQWYMLSFVYDGKTTFVYVNGNLVAQKQIRTGSYKLTGFWIGGANQYIREVRFYKTARTPKQIKDNIWKMANPYNKDLILYYPCNGMKLDRETGKVTEDTSMLWDWSQSNKSLKVPNGAIFDNNDGKKFVFPINLAQ